MAHKMKKKRKSHLRALIVSIITLWHSVALCEKMG